MHWMHLISCSIFVLNLTATIPATTAQHHGTPATEWIPHSPANGTNTLLITFFGHFSFITSFSNRLVHLKKIELSFCKFFIPIQSISSFIVKLSIIHRCLR